jgi:hypothetical protein
MQNVLKNQSALIIGAGSSITQYRTQILSFISNTNPVTFGINNMTSLLVPEYHLWTNNKRLLTFGHTIDKQSKVLFGSGLKEQNIQRVYGGSYQCIHYVDKPGQSISYDGKTIFGHFRTAGVLAIYLAHIMGAQNIYVIGMDGYTFNGMNGDQHCYGKGMTDSTDWQLEVDKDRLVYDILDNIQCAGVNFSIITPTVFEKHYESLLI